MGHELRDAEEWKLSEGKGEWDGALKPTLRGA